MNDAENQTVASYTRRTSVDSVLARRVGIALKKAVATAARFPTAFVGNRPPNRVADPSRARSPHVRGRGVSWPGHRVDTREVPERRAEAIVADFGRLGEQGLDSGARARMASATTENTGRF